MNSKYYMLTVIVWIAIAIIASAISAHGNESQPVPTLTMSATWAIATPTPPVAAPGQSRVWLPVVMGGG